MPNPKQKILCESEKDETWALGGNRSGKTEWLTADFLAGSIMGKRKRKLAPRKGGWLIYFCSTTRDKQREVIQEKVLKYIPKMYIKKIYATRECWEYMELEHPTDKKSPINGTKIFFKTYESGVKAFEGASIDIACCDEEPPKPIYEAIQARLLDRKRVGNGIFGCAMTPDPDEGLTWTFYEVVENNTNPDRVVVHVNTYDNKENLGQKEIKKLEDSYDEDTRRARIYGLHVNRAGFVLKSLIPHNYPHGNILPSFHPDWSMFTPYEMADYGFKHPFHIGFYAVNKENEIIKYAEIHIVGKTIRQVKRELYFIRREYGYKEPHWGKMDPSANVIQGTSGYSPITLLAFGLDPTETDKPDVYIGPLGDDGVWPDRTTANIKQWIYYPVFYANANNDRDAGWGRLNGRLFFTPGVNRPNFFYTDNCVNSIRQAKNLCWPRETAQRELTKAREIARKREDDGPDCDRYASNDDIYYEPSYNPKYSLTESTTLDTESKTEEARDNVTGW